MGLRSWQHWHPRSRDARRSRVSPRLARTRPCPTTPFDKPDVLPGGAKTWHNFKIPKDTVIPESLTVRFTGHNTTFGADHWQIESKAGTMAMGAMKGALDNLARNAIVRLIELGEAAASTEV